MKTTIQQLANVAWGLAKERYAGKSFDEIRTALMPEPVHSLARAQELCEFTTAMLAVALSETKEKAKP